MSNRYVTRFAVLVVVLATADARAQVCPQQTRDPAAPLTLRFLTQQPPCLGPNASLFDIALNTEYTMRNCSTGSCAYAAVRNAELIARHTGGTPRIYVTVDHPQRWRTSAGHATAEVGGTHLNRGQLNTLPEVLAEWRPRGHAYPPFTRDQYLQWELDNFNRNVNRVPWGARLTNELTAGATISGGFAGGIAVGYGVDRAARYYDLDPVYRVGLVQTGGYLGSTAGSAATARGLAYLGRTPKMPVGSMCGTVGGTLLGAGTAGLGVHATMWHDVIEPEASNAMNQIASGNRQSLPSFRHVSDGGANLRRELARQRAEAEYFQCIARGWGLGIFFCSYPAHWK